MIAINAKRLHRIKSATVVVVLLSSLLAVTYARAQFTTACLTGSTIDTTGSAVAGATVLVEQLEIGFSRLVMTDAAGEFLSPSLPVGT